MEAIKRDTAVLMEEYNFNAPIDVKIIYDDDEETNEDIFTQNESVHCGSRQWKNMLPSNLESNLGVQAQALTVDQNKCNVYSDTLNVVIDNMSAILGAYFKFKQIHKTLTAAEIRRFKEKIMEMKYLLFKRSIMVTKSILLPQKNNDIFIRNIVHEILQKTKVNSNMLSTARLLYSDLLAWTEAQIENKKKEQIRPIKLGLNTIQSNNTANHLNSECRKRRCPANDVRKESATVEKLRNNGCPLTIQSSGPTSYPSSVNNTPSCVVHYPPNLPAYHNPQEINFTEINNFNTATNIQGHQNYLSTPQFGVHSTLEYQKSMQTNISQSVVINSPYFEKTGSDGQDISRSSVSRDSGFISPDIYSPQETMNINYQDHSSLQTSVTPNTDLSNVSSNRREGSCTICGKQTDLLCLGCFQYYYCSMVCQKVHWHSHKLECLNYSSPENNTFGSNYENIR